MCSKSEKGVHGDVLDVNSGVTRVVKFGAGSSTKRDLTKNSFLWLHNVNRVHQVIDCYCQLPVLVDLYRAEELDDAN